MLLPVWIALFVLVLSLTWGVVVCFRSGRALWRDVKSFGVELDGAVAALADTLESTAERSTRFGAGQPRLETAVAGLQASWRRWAVLRASVADVRAALVGIYPRK